MGHALKLAGLRVHANDHNAYAHVLARCHVAADAQRWAAPAERLLAELQEVAPAPGWFTELYAVRSRYLQPANAAKAEAILASEPSVAYVTTITGLALVVVSLRQASVLLYAALPLILLSAIGRDSIREWPQA